MITRALLLTLLLAVTTDVSAAEPMTGTVSIGWRSVSVDGAQAKYDEDINLQDGPRLLDASLSFRPSDSLYEWPDLVAVDVEGLGEPFERWRVAVRKYGSYRFEAQRQTSDYFYDDVIVLPENASIAGSTGGDFHRFDFERIRDNVALGIQVTDRAALNFNLERFEKQGSSTTTLDIQRDEFELDKPIDEVVQTISVGGSYRWDRWTLSVEERIREYDNHTEVFLPGFSTGENATDSATLDFFFLDQPYSFTSHEHAVRVGATPTARLEWRLSAVLSDLDLDVSATERSQGMSFQALPFVTDSAGDGDIERDVALYDFGFSFVLSDRVELVGGVRQHRLDQSANFPFGTDSGGQSRWEIDTTGYQLGAQLAVLPGLIVTAGWVGEQRDADVFEVPAGEVALQRNERTSSDGFFGTLDYRPNSALKLTASIDDSSIDDPYTLTSAADATRYRMQGRYRHENGVAFTATHTRVERDNESANWSYVTEQSDIQMSYATERLTLSVGASRVDLSRDFERLVTGGSRQDLFRVGYTADTSNLNVSARWAATEHWAFGGHYRRYDNDGSFSVKRDDALGFVETRVADGYTLRFSYRYLDYAEGGTEDYDADLLEAVLRFSF